MCLYKHYLLYFISTPNIADYSISLVSYKYVNESKEILTQPKIIVRQQHIMQTRRSV